MNTKTSAIGALSVAAALAALMFAQEADAARFPKAGSTRSRLGLGIFSTTTTTVDEDGNREEQIDFGMSVLVGASYAVAPRLMLDADLGLFFDLGPIDLTQVEFTPGARIFVTPSFYLRGAYAVRMMDPTNQLGLIGLGTYFGGSRVRVFAELNYIAYAQRDVGVNFLPRVGAELTF